MRGVKGAISVHVRRTHPGGRRPRRDAVARPARGAQRHGPRLLARPCRVAAAEVARRDDVRVLVVAARGPHFSVGLDLKEFGDAGAARERLAAPRPTPRATTGSATAGVGERDRQPRRPGDRRGARLLHRRRRRPHHRVRRPAVLFATRCSRCARPRSRSSRTSGPSSGCRGSSASGHVAELAYTGKDIDASRAAAIGLVNASAAATPMSVYEAATALAREIAANSPLAVRGTKAVLAANERTTVEEGLDFVARGTRCISKQRPARGDHRVHRAPPARLHRRLAAPEPPAAPVAARLLVELTAPLLDQLGRDGVDDVAAPGRAVHGGPRWAPTSGAAFDRFWTSVPWTQPTSARRRS